MDHDIKTDFIYGVFQVSVSNKCLLMGDLS